MIVIHPLGEPLGLVQVLQRRPELGELGQHRPHLDADLERQLGFQATIFALTNDEPGDARLVGELELGEYAPRSKIILVRGPEDVVPPIARVLGENLP